MNLIKKVVTSFLVLLFPVLSSAQLLDFGEKEVEDIAVDSNYVASRPYLTIYARSSLNHDLTNNTFFNGVNYSLGITANIDAGKLQSLQLVLGIFKVNSNSNILTKENKIDETYKNNSTYLEFGGRYKLKPLPKFKAYLFVGANNTIVIKDQHSFNYRLSSFNPREIDFKQKRVRYLIPQFGFGFERSRFSFEILITLLNLYGEPLIETPSYLVTGLQVQYRLNKVSTKPKENNNFKD